MATRHRPARGKAGPEIELGDPFGQYEQQGGEAPGATESGDKMSREFGVPQADIPGGVNHLVNTQTHPAKPAHKGFQPADYHKAHGVPPDDLEGYTFPPKADELGKQPKPDPEPKISDAVPVFIVQDEGKSTVRRTTACFNINIAAFGSEPTRICNRDDKRVAIKILNEDSATDIRFSENYTQLLTQSAQGTGPAGEGALLWHGTNSYTEIDTQESLYGITTSSSATARMSVIIITEVAEA